MKRKINYKKYIYGLVTTFSLGFGVAGISLGSCSHFDQSKIAIMDEFKFKDYMGSGKELSIDQKVLQKSLKNLGATRSNPLVLKYKAGKPSFSVYKSAWYQNFQRALSIISNGLMEFSWEMRSGSTISIQDWFVNGNSPLGFLFWSPDYSYSGTWFDPYYTFNKNLDMSMKFISFFPTLVHALKLCNDSKYANSVNDLNKWHDDYFTNNNKKLSFVDIGKDLAQFLVVHKIFNQNWMEAKDYIDDYKGNYHQFLSDKENLKKIFVMNPGENSSDSDAAADFARQMGIWLGAGSSDYRVLWLSRVLDSDMLIIPDAQPSMMDPEFYLKRKWVNLRNSINSAVNYADYGYDLTQFDGIGEKGKLYLKNIQNPFSDSLVPLTSGFQASSVAPFFQSNLINLVSWVNVDDKESSSNAVKSYLMLTGAKDLKIYDGKGGVIWQSKKPHEIFNFEDPGSDNYINSDKLTKAVRYEFTIDQNLKWTDKDGREKWSLSGKDFERALEVYDLACEIQFSKNDYFSDLVGVNLDETINKSHQSIVDPKYDINNFESSDDKFVVHLKNQDGVSASPYVLDILSKEFYSALPYQADSVKTIKVYNEEDGTGSVKLLKNGTIDNSSTDFKRIYGGGNQPEDILREYYAAGPYVVSKINFDSFEIVFSKNESYWKSIGEHLENSDGTKRDLNNKDKLFDKVVMKYGSGDQSTFYENFKSNSNLDLMKLEDSRYALFAVKDGLKENLFDVLSPHTSTTSIVIYSGCPRTQDGKLQSHIPEITGKFLENFGSEDSKIIRASILALINLFTLSKQFSTFGDFQLSAIPNGIFKINSDNKNENYYEYIVKGNKADGLLPRPYIDYTNDFYHTEKINKNYQILIKDFSSMTNDRYLKV